MKEFDDSIPSSRKIFGRRFSMMRVAEVGFGWVAKGTAIIALIIWVVVTVISGGEGLTSLPLSRRQWLIFILLILLLVVGAVAYQKWGPANAWPNDKFRPNP